MKVKVYNMTSPKGNQVPNQFEIYTSKGRYFQSYNSIIAFIDNNGNVFDNLSTFKMVIKYFKRRLPLLLQNPLVIIDFIDRMINKSGLEDATSKSINFMKNRLLEK